MITTTTKVKYIVLFCMVCLATIWAVLIFADEIDGTMPREQQQQATYALQVQTIELLRQDLNDCKTALKMQGTQTLFLLPPVKDEAVIKAWRNHKRR